MMMTIMPKCCTARLAVSFDKTNGSNTHDVFGDTPAETPTNVLDWVKTAVIQCKRKGYATLLFNTKSDQVMINEVLILLGADHTPWMRKTKHLETKLRTWWFPLFEYEMPGGSLGTLRKDREEHWSAEMALMAEEQAEATLDREQFHVDAEIEDGAFYREQNRIASSWE